MGHSVDGRNDVESGSNYTFHVPVDQPPQRPVGHAVGSQPAAHHLIGVGKCGHTDDRVQVVPARRRNAYRLRGQTQIGGLQPFQGGLRSQAVVQYRAFDQEQRKQHSTQA